MNQLQTAVEVFRTFGSVGSTDELGEIETPFKAGDVLRAIADECEKSERLKETDDLRLVLDTWDKGDNSYAVAKMLTIARARQEDFAAIHAENEDANKTMSGSHQELMSRMAKERELAERALTTLRWAAALKRESVE